MSMLDEITQKLGGQQGQAGGLASLQKLISSSGGLQGLTQKLANGGLAQQVQSWIGTGQNQPVSGSQIQPHMDSDQLGKAASQAGMTKEQTCDHVAQALPHMVDQATPQGQMPAAEADPFTKGVNALKQILGI